jgi:hypothetical protein
MMIEVTPCCLEFQHQVAAACGCHSPESAAVGSSRISSLTSLDSALAISTSCCLPTPMAVDLGQSALRAGRPWRSSSLGAPVGLAPVDHARFPRTFVAEKDVLRDRQLRHQREFLVNDDDALIFSLSAMSGEADRLAVVTGSPVVGRADRRRRGLSSASTCRRRFRRRRRGFHLSVTSRLTSSSAFTPGKVLVMSAFRGGSSASSAVGHS